MLPAVIDGDRKGAGKREGWRREGGDVGLEDGSGNGESLQPQSSENRPAEGE